jgi:hypothetical protein
VAILQPLFSCDKDDTQKVVVLETKTVSNLPAPQTGGQGQPEGGPFTKFSFSKMQLQMMFGISLLEGQNNC